MGRSGSYVYCLVAAGSRPVLRRRLPGLPGTGPVRLLDAGRGLWLVVADAPLDRYGEDAINRKLSDIDWVSRAAMAHEAVVESFIGERAVLPMKLFTIFTSDDRALGHVRGDRPRVDALISRVANRLEWGVRVTLDRARVAPSPTAATGRRRSPARARGAVQDGASYLSQKKAMRDAVLELAGRAAETVAGLYDRLADRSDSAKRRTAGELPAEGAPLLLDAAFLVPRARAASFRALMTREARALARTGYRVALSGPWPPYTFVKD
jgi:hypothetical protein